MAKVQTLNKAIVKEPEVAGTRVERKNPSVIEDGQVSVAPKPKDRRLKRQSILEIPSRPDNPRRAQLLAKHHARPPNGRVIMPPKPEPTEEPPLDAPIWTPDVREPDPDLQPDELPDPNPDENRDPPMKAL
ncbi:hypothetical protein [Mesorhizobium sp. M00.F.Ca.ET.216.01.1.1]|uniref:hypothetical protein n=1 Tax=Mesorhizobium sp. M00.F.Ca.ET.216.01.1.1 TaxID=2500528 RepID=UPI00167A61CD|nr:hypothetical protein [Mesorhizobium sp. M00.F.Ca.ET.216.01.1.1]